MSIKSNINTILKSVSSSVTVLQNRPESDEQLPCFIFNISGDEPYYSFEEIAYRDIEVTVDIFANTSKTTSTLLESLIATMFANKYMLSFSRDIEDPSGKSHVTTLFKFIK